MVCLFFFFFGGGEGGYTQGEAAYHHAFCQSHEDSIIKSRVKKHERIPVKKKKKKKKEEEKATFCLFRQQTKRMSFTQTRKKNYAQGKSAYHYGFGQSD